jgi:hypothetical protein
VDRISSLYSEEKRLKEHTECYLDMTYDDLMSERRMRVEAEDMLFRKNRETEKQIVKKEQFSEGSIERRLILHTKLKEEVGRLTSFIEVISAKFAAASTATL